MVGNTVLDGTAPNQVTWKMLYAGRVGNETRATTLLISDCTINGNNNAAINNELRISGLGGGMAVIRNLNMGGLATAAGSFGDGSDGLLIDDGQNNLLCTGPGAPLACCTGSHAGSCNGVSTYSGTSYLKIDNLFLSPGVISGNGPAYGVRVYSGTSGSRISDIEFDSGQIGDIYGSNNLALLGLGGGAGAVDNISVKNIYFEIGTGGAGGHPQAAGSDVIYDNATALTVEDSFLGQGNAAAVANCLNIDTVLNMTRMVRFANNRIFNSPCTNAVQNSVSGETLSVGSNQNFNYVWQKRGSNVAPYMLDADTQLLGHLSFAQPAAPTLTGSGGTCGTSDTLTAGSNDQIGQFTTGSGTVSSCVITFNAAFTNAPFSCMAVDVTASPPAFLPASATTGALTVTVSNTAHTVNYLCLGPKV